MLLYLSAMHVPALLCLRPPVEVALVFLCPCVVPWQCYLPTRVLWPCTTI